MNDKVKEVIASVLKVDVVGLEDDLAIGDIPEWDSLRHMMIIKALEAEFKIVMPMEQIRELEDVSDIVALVEELKA